MSLGEFSRLPSNLSAITVAVPVILVADDAAAAVFAGKLPAFEVEGVAIAVAGGVAECGDPAVLLDPAHLDVVRDVAPNQIPAYAVPRGSFGPQGSGIEALDSRVADDVPPEAVVERNDIGIGVLNRLPTGPVAGRSVGADGLLRGLSDHG